MLRKKWGSASSEPRGHALWFSAYVPALVMYNKLMSSKKLIYVTNILFSIKQLLILTIVQYSREIKVINLPILNVYILCAY